MPLRKSVFLWSLLLLLPLIGNVEEASTTKLGMWSWSQSNFDTVEARTALLDFCAEESISHLDQHISLAKTASGYEVKNAEALESLIQAAAKQGITVNALRGERTMFFAANHKKTLAQLKALIAFNRKRPKNARFAGIKYDVEPYLTAEWKAGGSPREKVILDYLSFLQQARAMIDAESPGLELSVDIPFWWDKPEFALEVNGKKQLLIHHIIDLTDWIGIMSYRRSSEEVLRLTTEEFDYAKKIAKPRSIAPGINTMNVKGSEHHTSFGGLSVAELRKTISELRVNLAEVGEARYLLIHDYRNFVEFLEAAPEVPVLEGE